MEKHILELFNDSYIDRAGDLYGFHPDTVEKLDGFENLMFSYSIGDKKYILRIAHHDHQTFEHIMAEIEFIQYLQEHGANVVVPVRSLDGELSERLGNGFTASCFHYAPGRHASREDHSEAFYQEYGRVMATMHKLTVDYVPKHKRYAWDEDILFDTCEQYLPKDKLVLMDRLNQSIDRLNTYPKQKDSYGLIHTDMHLGNFFIDEGTFHVFDFDDSAYKWFVSDIAIVLFYLIWFKEGDNQEFVDFVMENFMKGYNEVYQLDNFWFEKFDEFLKFRRLLMFLVVYRSFDSNNFPDWIKKFHEVHYDKTINDEAMCDIDFTKYNKKAA